MTGKMLSEEELVELRKWREGLAKEPSPETLERIAILRSKVDAARARGVPINLVSNEVIEDILAFYSDIALEELEKVYLDMIDMHDAIAAGTPWEEASKKVRGVNRD